MQPSTNQGEEVTQNTPHVNPFKQRGYKFRNKKKRRNTFFYLQRKNHKISKRNNRKVSERKKVEFPDLQIEVLNVKLSGGDPQKRPETQDSCEHTRDMRKEKPSTSCGSSNQSRNQPVNNRDLKIADPNVKSRKPQNALFPLLCSFLYR